MTITRADLVLHEGVVLGHPESDSIAIGEGRIIAHGRFAELKALVGPRTHLVRLAGRTAAPGFVDSHLHFLEAAAAFSVVQLHKARSLSELFLELRAQGARTAPGNWLKAFGCDEALLSERRGPTRKELDEAVTKNPLRLRHQTLHASWLNSRAIALLGLERSDFVPPAGAHLARGAEGRLTGLVVGMEQWITDRLPRITSADLEARARIFSRELAAAGVTAFTDATARNGLDEVRLFAKLASGPTIGQRVAIMLGADSLEAAGEARRIAEPAGVSIAGAKFMDVASKKPRELAHAVRRAASLRLDCAFHATEVEELDAALQVIESVHRHWGTQAELPVAMRIEHGGLIAPNQLEPLAAAGAWVVSNPGFLYYRGAKYAAEPGLVPYLYRASSLARAGIKLAGGTDAPVTPARPLVAIAAAVSRLSLEGYELAPSESLDPGEAFALFTAAGARLTRLNCGEIAPERLADLIVLARDPLALKPAELINLQVDMTIVAGRIVYERGRPEVASGIPSL